MTHSSNYNAKNRLYGRKFVGNSFLGLKVSFYFEDLILTFAILSSKISYKYSIPKAKCYIYIDNSKIFEKSPIIVLWSPNSK